MKHEEPFLTTVNDQHEFNITPETALQLDAVREEDGVLHVILNNKVFRAELLSADDASHLFVLKIDGNEYHVNIADKYDRLVSQLGLKAGGQQKANQIKAPMPGLVLNLLVEAGQEVSKGDPLLILEAMKMENVIKASGDGKVKSVNVKKGDAVDKGLLLVEME
jgi:biotin carboxyl carrier protein